MSKRDPIPNELIVSIESDAKITVSEIRTKLKEQYPLSRFKIKRIKVLKRLLYCIEK